MSIASFMIDEGLIGPDGEARDIDDWLGSRCRDFDHIEEDELPPLAADVPPPRAQPRVAAKRARSPSPHDGNRDIPGYVAGRAGKCYAVRVGRAPGIYPSWLVAEEQTRGVPRGEHRKFGSHDQAAAWLRGAMVATAGYGEPGETARRPGKKRKYVHEYWNGYIC